MRQAFAYCFVPQAHEYAGGVPQLEIRRIGLEPFSVLGARVIPFRLEHGRFRVLGFRIGNVAYCTDTNKIPDESWPLLEGVKILIIDALRFKSHPAHFGLQDALDVIERVNPERAYLTHMSHEFDYETLPAKLPGGVFMAYDGLRFQF